MRHLVTFIFFSLSFQSFGQFIKGDKVLGGWFSYVFQRAPESPNGGLTNKATTFSITPNFGILLSESWELGLEVGYSSTASERNTTLPMIYNWNSRGMNSGIYTQRYFVISQKFLFSVSGKIRYQFGETFNKTTNTITNEVTESEEKTTSVGAILKPRFIFFPTNNLAFQAELGYISYSYSRNDSQPLHLLNINYGAIDIGLAYYFRKKVKD